MSGQVVFKDPTHPCKGYGHIAIAPYIQSPPNGLPLQLRRIDRTTAIEATLEGRTVLLTGTQVEQFWKMVEGLK